MSNKVYVFGAGVNQSIRKYVSNNIYYSPPLSKNFFEVLFGIYSIENDFTKYYNELCHGLSNYILEYWKMGKHKLTESELDLEELYTFIQLQREEAESTSDSATIRYLDNIYSTLNRLFLSVLHDFKRPMYYLESEAFLKLGRLLYKEKPTIITFNYDDFIERTIEFASGRKNIAINHHSNSAWNWNRALAYGFKFNEIAQYQKPEKRQNPKLTTGDNFYTDKELDNWNILKLHGSINWWHYGDTSPNPNLSREYIEETYTRKKDTVLLEDRDVHYHLPPIYTSHQLNIAPIIIPPFLHKTFYSHNQIYDTVFRTIREKAKNALSKCECLVIIGYSFPPTDFLTKKLFLESFSKNNNINDIIIVDPNSVKKESELRKKVQSLCHFENVIPLENLHEYLKLFPADKVEENENIS